MENNIVAEVATISYDDGDIDEPIPKKRAESHLFIVNRTSAQHQYIKKY